MTKQILVTLIFLVYSIPSFAGMFDDLGAGARASAMGEAFTAVGEDASSIYFNPAALARFKKRQMDGMHTDLFSLGLVDYNMVAYAHPGIAKGVVGFMYQGVSTTDNVDFMKFQESTYTLSYAYQFFDSLSVGINGKYYYADFAREGSGVGFDVSGLLRISNRFQLGLMLKNINSPAIHLNNQSQTDIKNTDTLDRDIRIGLVSRPFDSLLLTTDLVHLESTVFEYRAGMEYRFFKNRFALRAGVIDKRRNQFLFTLGGGVIVDKFRLDYAFRSHPDLKETHYVSLHYEF